MSLTFMSLYAFTGVFALNYGNGLAFRGMRIFVEKN